MAADEAAEQALFLDNCEILAFYPAPWQGEAGGIRPNCLARWADDRGRQE
jgi:hypothetical protein